MAKETYGHCFYGVDYSVPPHEILNTVLADAQNILPTHSGLPKSRGGSVKYNNVALGSGARITSFFEFKSGTSRESLVSYSTKVGLYSSSTGEFSDIITGLTDDQLMQWVNFAGKAIGVNGGSDPPQYFTSSALCGALAGTPPNGRSITEWSNRVWYGGDATNVATLTGSGLNDPTDYASAGATGYVSQIIGDSKDPITGLYPYFDILLVGKQNNIYKVSGDPPTDADSLEIKPLYTGSDNVGFTSPWAITQIGNDIIFLDGYDIRLLTGIQEYGDLEHRSIIPHFRDFLRDTVDRDYLQYTQFFHYKKEQQIWVTIPTGADTHYVFVLDYKFKQESNRFAFYPLGGLNAVCFGGRSSGEVTDIYYGDESGFVHALDIGDNDNGSAIESYFVTVVSGNQTRENIVDKHEIRKQFQYTDTYIKPGSDSLTMTPYYAIDLLDDSQIRDSDNYTALDSEVVSSWTGTGTKQKKIRFFGLSGKTLALKWYHNTRAQSYTFYPSIIDYQWKSRTTIS